MRVLSLGFPLPSPSIDNFSFLSAPAFFDYEVIVVDPRKISQLIDDVISGNGDHTTFAGERVVNRPMSDADSISLAELLHNRSDETALFLSRGGVIICLAVPNAPHQNVAGYDGFNRYAWLPKPSGISFDPPFMKRASGAGFAPFDFDHPFGPALHKMANRLAYQVYFDDHVPGFNHQVIARSTGGAAVAVALTVAGGRIIFIPPPAQALDSQHRYQAADALQEAMRGVLRASSQSAAPAWIREYNVPGLDALQNAHDQAASDVATAREALSAAAEELEGLTLYQALLWQEGQSFEEAVRVSLTLLGFAVAPPDLSLPARIDSQEPRPSPRSALLETHGSEEEVGLDAHYRMRRRLEEALARGTAQRGVMVVNGVRRTPPSERPQQFANELLSAAQQLGYCLVTGEQVFAAVCASLRGDLAIANQFCERILETRGPVPVD